jgi:negative regulator of sigma E activity
VEDSVAPKVSALLSSAAQLLEPDKPRHRRWRTPIVIAAVTAAALAAAAIVRNRSKPDSTTSAANADDVAPAAEMGDGQTRTSTDAAADVTGL